MSTNSISQGPGRRPGTGFEYTPNVSDYAPTPLATRIQPPAPRHHLFLSPPPLSRTAELREFFAEGFQFYTLNRLLLLHQANFRHQAFYARLYRLLIITFFG